MKNLKTFEAFNEENLNEGIKGLLKQGAKATKKMGEDALYQLSNKFEALNDEDADEIASHLNMAIELMQDGYPKDATAHLKKFNKACKAAL